jgi:tripartite-type tricarboxylate transporter receptor subunit TctC
MRARCWGAILGLLGILGLASAAQAQDASSRPITLVVPFAAGGGVDTVARVLAERLSEKLHQNVVVENRPGGGGMIGIDYVARAAPDGHTLLLMDIAAVLIKWLHKTVAFDVVQDFVPIAKVANAQMVLFASAALPANNVKELVAYDRANPRGLLVGIPGVGTPHHLAQAMFNAAANINIMTVPYRGAAPALNDLVGGQIPTMWATPIAVMPFVKSGKVKALGVASPQRDPQLPDVPTFAESGYPGCVVDVWFGVAAPKGTAREVVARVSAAIAQITSSAEVQKRLAMLGFTLSYADSKEFGALVASDHARYGKVIRAAGIMPK